MADAKLSALTAITPPVAPTDLIYTVQGLNPRKATADQVREVARWDDVRIVPGAFDFAGAADPTLVDYTPPGSSVAMKLWEFALNDVAYFTVQLPHTYKEGTDIYPHVHWTPGPKGAAENAKNVLWGLHYSLANVNGVFSSGGPLDLSGICTGVDHSHLVSDSPAISGTALKISDVLVCRLMRSSAAIGGSSDTWAGTTTGNRPLLLGIDFHHEVDFLGSAQQFIKAHP